nr:PIN domain-containing protein [Desulfobulbaceae bacterium]
MALKYLLDTNVILYLLGGKLLEPLPEGRYFASVITELELLSYSLLCPKEEEKISQFLEEITVVELNPEIKKMTILIRRTHKIKLPDAIILATAQSLGAKIFSNDTQMAKIPHIDIIPLLLK